MVTAAIVCAILGLVLLAAGVAWLTSDDSSATDWRERTADTAADFRDWLRTGR